MPNDSGCGEPGVGVVVAPGGVVVVADEGEGEPGLGHLGGAERRVLVLVVALEREAADLGAVEQGEVQPGPVDPEAVEEAVGAAGAEVGRAPERAAVGQRDRLEVVGREEVDVGPEPGLAVEPGRGQPVVVAGGHEHREGVELGEGGLDEAHGVGAEPVVLVEVAGDQERVDLTVEADLHDVGERVADVGPPAAPDLGPRPGERDIEVDVGHHGELDRHGKTLKRGCDRNRGPVRSSGRAVEGVRTIRGMAAERLRSESRETGCVPIRSRMAVETRWVRYGRDAAEALRAEIVAAKGAEPLAPVTVVVPSNHVGVAARRLLASGRLGPTTSSPDGVGLVAVTFLTTYRLAELLGAPVLAGEGRRPVSTPVITAAMRRALHADAGHVRARRGAPGDRVGPRRLLPRAPRPVPGGAPCRSAGTGRRARDVVRLQGAARAVLETAWYDEEDLMAAAATGPRRGVAARRRRIGRSSSSPSGCRATPPSSCEP